MPIVAYGIKVPSRPKQVDPHVGFQADSTGTSSFLVVGRNASLWLQSSLSRGFGDEEGEDGLVNIIYGSIQCQAKDSSSVQQLM